MRAGRSAFASCAPSNISSRATVTSARDHGGLALGLLGGTFNPPHNGHVACARTALKHLGLDRVDFVPAGRPLHKDIEDPGGEHRYRMCLHAVAGHDGLGVSRLELDRPGPSYTVDTLRQLHASDEVQQLTFIVGADMAMGLGAWRQPAAILSLARVVVAPRGPEDQPTVAAALAGLPGGEAVDYLPMVEVDVSSSEVRRRAGAGLSVSGLVPEGVARYIAEQRLYMEAVA